MINIRGRTRLTKLAMRGSPVGYTSENHQKTEISLYFRAATIRLHIDGSVIAPEPTFSRWYVEPCGKLDGRDHRPGFCRD